MALAGLPGASQEAPPEGIRVFAWVHGVGAAASELQPFPPPPDGWYPLMSNIAGSALTASHAIFWHGFDTSGDDKPYFFFRYTAPPGNLKAGGQESQAQFL